MTTTPIARRLLPRGALLCLGGFCITACSVDPAADEIRPESELSIIKLPADHPPFFNDSVAFYAKPNSSAEGKLYFREPGGGRGEEWAVLKIDNQSLLARPDGSPFGANDSILIVMKVADQNLIMVELRPSGLRFRTDNPVELKLRYEETDGDLDGDGDSDNRDEDLETILSIWRQEKPGDPFVKIGTVKSEDARELSAFLTSFSRYAISY